jgi:hypothetical protein
MSARLVDVLSFCGPVSCAGFLATARALRVIAKAYTGRCRVMPHR